MMTFFMVVHLLVTILMVAVILLQKSEGGGLVGGSSSSSFMSARGSANFMTRLTAVLATLFVGLSLVLAIIAGTGKKSRSILDQPALTAPASIEPAVETKALTPNSPETPSK